MDDRKTYTSQRWPLSRHQDEGKSAVVFRVTQLIPCGGGLENFHRSPPSRRRRRKGNPVPGVRTGPPCSWGIQIWGPGPPGWESLESETVKCGQESRGTRTPEWLYWRGQAAKVNERPIFLSERMLNEDYDRRCLLEIINAGRESQGIVAKTNWLAVNRQSWSDSDSE
jgi:hypothetical protein